MDRQKSKAQETRSDDDGLDLSEDDFFLCGSSSDEADADDELTDKSARLGLVLKFVALTRMSTHVPILCWDQASSASGNEAAASGMSSNERNQTHISARTLMSLPRASNISRQVHAHQRDQASKNEAAAFDISARTLMSPPRASNVSSQVLDNQRLFIEQSLALNQTLELQRVNLEIELWTRKLEVKILKDKVLQKQAKEAHQRVNLEIQLRTRKLEVKILKDKVLQKWAKAKEARDSNKDLCAAVWCIVIVMVTFYGLVITLAKFKDKHEFTKGHHEVAVSIVLLVAGGLTAAFILFRGYKSKTNILRTIPIRIAIWILAGVIDFGPIL
nr:hypothetical protein [Tanacetum cinerariifolium]